mmetsp:Transcript_11530/g.43044  ORF Transcript_11530/g.43044 Transcript_11530/m.43044 type:complete len:336 (+) Transcript_11530:1774-2781(+)
MGHKDSVAEGISVVCVCTDRSGSSSRPDVSAAVAAQPVCHYEAYMAISSSVQFVPLSGSLSLCLLLSHEGLLLGAHALPSVLGRLPILRALDFPLRSFAHHLALRLHMLQRLPDLLDALLPCLELAILLASFLAHAPQRLLGVVGSGDVLLGQLRPASPVERSAHKFRRRVKVLRRVEALQIFLRVHEERVLRCALLLVRRRNVVQSFSEPPDLLLLLPLGRAEVGHILRLEQLHRVGVDGVVSVQLVDAGLGLGVHHAMVELVRVAQRRFASKSSEEISLLVMISRAFHVVLVLLQQPEAPTRARLSALLMRHALHGVAETGHAFFASRAQKWR